VPVNDRVPGRRPAASADTGLAAPVTGSRASRWLVAVLLIATAAMDLSRCGLAMATARHPGPAAGLVAAGLAAALSGWTACGCLAGRHWPTWAALLIGVASAPQAAGSGFGAPRRTRDPAGRGRPGHRRPYQARTTIRKPMRYRQGGHPMTRTAPPA